MDDRDEPVRTTTSGRENRARRLRLGPHLFAVGAAIVAGGLAFLALRAPKDAFGGLAIADYAAEAVSVDRVAPDFTLPSLNDAGPITMSAFRGKVVVLNFWASWCLPCRKEAPGLQGTWDRYRDRGMQFLGADERDDRAGAQSFVREFGLTYPSVFDPSGLLSAEYAVPGLPVTFVIDRVGRIRYQFTGYVTELALTDAIEKVLDPTSL